MWHDGFARAAKYIRLHRLSQIIQIACIILYAVQQHALITCHEQGSSWLHVAQSFIHGTVCKDEYMAQSARMSCTHDRMSEVSQSLTPTQCIGMKQ